MKNIVRVDKWNPDEDVISRAAELIRAGGLVAFPTETVYGLGANGLDAKAASGIYAAKGRPCDNPLILHVAFPSDVNRVAVVTPLARRLMERFWPGPLTLVLEALPSVPLAVRGGLETVAVRMPAHPVALALIEKSGVPLAAPSANRSGRPSPTEAKVVAEDLGDAVQLVLDGGPADVGVESTVLDVSGGKAVLLRPGGVSFEELEEFVGEVFLPQGIHEKRRSPGTRYRHYAPSVDLLIWDKNEGEFPKIIGKYTYLGVGRNIEKCERAIFFDSLEGYARGFFAALRELEALRLPIVAELPEEKGIGRALRDRILRASGRGLARK